MNTTDKIMALADEYMRRPLVDSRDGSTTRNALRTEIEALVRDAERWRKFLSTRPPETHAVINEAIDAMQEKQS